MVNKKEAVNHPPHYNKGKFEVIDVINDWELNFALGNTVKYIARAPHKSNPEEDLNKAAWYLNYQITKNKRDVKILELMTEQINDALIMSEISKEELLDMVNWLHRLYDNYTNAEYKTPTWYHEFVQANDIFNKTRLRTSGLPNAKIVIKRFQRLEMHSGPILDFIIKSKRCKRVDIVNTFEGVNTSDAKQILQILEDAGLVSLIRSEFGQLQYITPSSRTVSRKAEVSLKSKGKA